MFRKIAGAFEFIATLNSPNRRYNVLPAIHPLPPPARSLIRVTCDSTVAVQIVAQNPAVLPS